MYHRLDRRGALLVEQKTGDLIEHGFCGAATPVGQNGRATGLGLDRGNAKILFSGKDERARPLHVRKQDVVGLITEDLHVRTGERAAPLHLWTGADHDQPAIRHRRERLDNQMHLLVRDHAGRGKIEVLPRVTDHEVLHGNVWIDDGR